MKKASISKSLCAAILILSAIIFSSCINPTPGNSTEGVCKIVIVEEGGPAEYTVTFNEENSTEGVFGLVKEVCERENIHFKYNDSAYGAYIEEIASIIPNGAVGEYVGIYTSVISDFDVSLMYSEYEYGSLTLGSLGVGISSAKLEDGATYLLKITSY